MMEKNIFDWLNGALEDTLVYVGVSKHLVPYFEVLITFCIMFIVSFLIMEIIYILEMTIL